MTEEPRRSGRATKGQHKHASSSPAPTPKAPRSTKSKPTKKQVAAEPEVNEGEDDKIRCICGNNDPKDKRAFIGCDACEVWQHNVCMGMPDDEEEVPDHYFCEECGPDMHQETLQALARGEKIWETRSKIWQNEKKSRARKSKGKAGEDLKPGWLKKDIVPPTEPVVEPPAPTAEASPETGSKRKRDDAKQEAEEAEVKADQQEDKTAKPARQDKRRKSSTAETKPSAVAKEDVDTALVGIDQLPADRQKVAQVLSKIIADDINKRVKAGYKIPEGQTARSLGDHHATRIEYALHMNHGSPTEAAYGTQFRALNANMKKNKVLVERIINDTLTADELSTMNSSDMASEELQKERAIMKEALDRQAIAIPEEGPRYRQDHKGYRLIEDENQHLTDHPMPRPGASASKDEIPEDRESSQPATAQSPVEMEPTPVPVETKKPSSPGKQRRSSSQQFDMSNIWAKAAQSPTTAAPQIASKPVQPTRRPSSSQPVGGHQNGAKDDPDVDRMLEDHDDTYSPADYTASDAVVWRGKLVQANEENSPVVEARFVAGRDLAPTVSWPSLLPESLSIDGRLQIQKAEDYLCGLRWSNTSDVAVLALTPHENKEAFNATFEYFFSRQRYAVVEKGKPAMVKDLYIIPVEAGAKLPAHVEMLYHCTIKKPVEERLLLATLIVARAPDSPPAGVDGTPSARPTSMLPQHVRQSIGGPAGSPLTAQPSVFSPPGNTVPSPGGYGAPNAAASNPYGTPSQQQMGAYPHHQPHPNPRVNAILGDLQYEPTAQQVLAADPNLDETRLQNLRAVLIDEPNARTDLNVLSARLFQSH